MKAERQIETWMMNMKKKGQLLVDKSGSPELYNIPEWYVKGLKPVLQMGPTEVEFNSGQKILIDDVTTPLENPRRGGRN